LLSRCLPLVAVCLVGCGEDSFAPFGEEPSDGEDPSDGEGSSSGGEQPEFGEPEKEPEPPLPEFAGEPLPEAPEGVWQWVDFPESRCRDGSSTGIGVRRGTTDKLVVYFEGGGACFNGFTCLANLGSFGLPDFYDWQFGSGDQGIFSTTREDNPVRDWSFVYVPYCTGDVHAGANSGVEIADVQGVQEFHGYTNVEAFLKRIVPSFGGASHVLVTGVSAGGFGAGFNYHRLARIFPGKVTLLDDSGPVLRDPYLAPCLQRTWREVWGLDATIPANCEACQAEDGGSISELVRWIGTRHPEQRMGLISSENDRTISTFFSFGLDECAGLGAIYPGKRFSEGLYDFIEAVLVPTGNWGSYVIPGTDHTWIGHSALYSTEVDGVRLVDWVRALLDGEVSHVAPSEE